MSFLRYVPPMGIYKTLYAFLESFGTYMGEPGTHPWSQGFPRTVQLPGGPEIPTSVSVTADHLKYPKAWGMPALREAIASYYRTHYGAAITAENVMIFAGGRPAIVAVLFFLDPSITVRIAETEYTPYYDILERLGRSYSLVHSGVENRFTPRVVDYLGVEGRTGFRKGMHERVTESGRGDLRGNGEKRTLGSAENDLLGGAKEGIAGSQRDRFLILLSNPCNPTGVTREGEALKWLLDDARTSGAGILFDEAYELFHEPPVSSLRYVADIEEDNVFVVGAATKGLQAPGIRIGWVVASKRHVEILGNFSSFGMGGVSHPSQCFALELLREERVARARKAVPSFYAAQRDRYGEACERLGLDCFSGNGGFYHWCRLSGGMTAADLNRRLFKEGAAVLEGPDCDMARRGESSPLESFFRFSFGPLDPASFETDIEILKRALRA